ncbi:MAG: HD domain-containing protein [Campylobacterales bacterium]|nr:HD domain-containing protein [Campylobacterales bacterium]
MGIKNIDQKILHKNDTLTQEELALVRKHPELSVEILERNLVLDTLIINGIKEHHENQNGTGYPNQFMGRRISKFGAIIAIADVFDALTNSRPHREAYSSFEALRIMMKDESMARKFNFSYLEAFLRLLKS